MAKRDNISYEEFLKQFTYVNRVVCSCTNPLQREAAKKWARNWVERMRKSAPDFVHNKEDLYLAVIEDECII